MRKLAELNEQNSCLSKAHPDELLFVLLGRDSAAPDTIRFWVRCRLASGKNEPSDPQIVEALQCADLMEQERRDKEPPHDHKDGSIPTHRKGEVMVTLKDIEAALADKNYVHADYLTAQWWKDRRLEEQAKPSTWTTVKPTTPGWYWWRSLNIGIHQRCTEVYQDSSGKLFCIYGLNHGEWSSEPIAEPQEAT